MRSGARQRLVVGVVAGVIVIRQQWRFAHLGRTHYAWAPILIVATITVVALVLPTVHRSLPRPGAPAVLVAAWAAAIYSCIPETGRQPGLLAMVFGLGAWELLSRTTLPWPVHMAEIFLLVSSGVFGTAGWPAALLGALFGVWPFLLVTAASRVGERSAAVSPARMEVIAAIGCAGSIVVARTGALVHPGIHGALTTIAIVTAACLAASAAVALVRREVTAVAAG